MYVDDISRENVFFFDESRENVWLKNTKHKLIY